MLESLLPESFQLWHLFFLFLAALVGESFGTVIGGGSIITQSALLMTGLPLNATIATDNAGQLGPEVGIISETKAEIAGNWKLIGLMALPLMLGTILGIYGLLNVSAELIKFVMVAAVLLLLLRTYFLNKHLKRWQSTRARYPAMFIFLFIVGAYSNFIGVGGGIFFRLGMMLTLGLSFMQSHGLRAMSILPTYVYVLPVLTWAGLVAWPYVLGLWAGGFLSGRYVTKYMKKIPERYTRPGLAVVASVFIAYLLLFV